MATPEKVDIEVRIAKEGNAVEAGLERIALRRGLPAKATA